jgi:hypothetical protein
MSAGSSVQDKSTQSHSRRRAVRIKGPGFSRLSGWARLRADHGTCGTTMTKTPTVCDEWLDDADARASAGGATS